MIILDDYNPTWPGRYEQERAAIVQAIGPHIGHIEHIGSTSIPGLAAKPVIDIGIDLNKYPLPAEAITAMEELGYEHKGEYGIHERHYFRKVSPNFHVHSYSPGNPEWDAHILFRDYLRAHPESAVEYEQLKRGLAARHSDVNAYAEDKTDFVKGTVAKSREWRMSNEEKRLR